MTKRATEMPLNRWDPEATSRMNWQRLVRRDGQAQDHRYELAWVRAEDVRRFLKT